ncbi:TerD family protein [Nocardioides sp. Kera G14]|uniref:TerD family protein n=1 Tax=Nocardioides sp. Kera G14 TaxID=2884264 RepID=UPI001D12C037|nr:TerD family protein [Nocardioides sp. Kera G14]UDY23241.1 TerD family protein [Nocardioides sp. Kera G14]
MALMQRGANVALTREVPSLTGVVIGVRWNAGAETALDRNLVMATLLCDRPHHVPSEEHLVFFNQLTSPDESVSQRETALDGDTEQVEIDLAGVPDDISRIVVAVYVNEGPGPRRTLGQLRSCEVRVLNAADGAELVRSEDLAPALTSETALTLAEMYRHDGGWKFKVLGQGYAGGVSAMARDFGLSV